MKILLAGGYDTKNLGDHGSLEVFPEGRNRSNSTLFDNDLMTTPRQANTRSA